VLAAAAAVLVGWAPALATTTSFVPSHDNTLYQDAAGALSNGAGPNFIAGTTERGLVRRGLLEFDLSSIPAGATVNSATLTLFVDQVTVVNPGPVSVELHRSLGDWGEGTSNAGVNSGMGVPATTNDATWIHTRFNTAFWTTAGGDFAPDVSAATTVSGVGSYSWSSAGLVADVQSWMSGTSPNFGWEVLGGEHASGTAKRIVSREGAIASQQPVLAVDYTVPAPGGLAGVGMGLVLAARRRRGLV
jgi:hypothetical protein